MEDIIKKWNRDRNDIVVYKRKRETLMMGIEIGRASFNTSAPCLPCDADSETI